MRINGTLQTEENMVISTHSEEELQAIVHGLASQTIRNMLDQRAGVVSTLTRLLKQELKQRITLQHYMSDKEIVQYYGQIWENVKHMKSYVKELKQRYIKETQS